MKEKTLGILGGVGPLATVYFSDMVVKMTEAKRDQDHIDMVILNHASIPDRTDYILDNTKPNPLPVMVQDAKHLAQFGVDFIVIPCNTAHYFYEQIQASVAVPIVNIIEETVKYAKEHVPHLKKLGVLATRGTIASQAYQTVMERHGVGYAVPDEANQKKLMSIIYEQVKAGGRVDIGAFMSIILAMKKQGCEAVILGCTELSIIKQDFSLHEEDIIDSMEVLARKSIALCGKEIKG